MTHYRRIVSADLPCGHRTDDVWQLYPGYAGRCQVLDCERLGESVQAVAVEDDAGGPSMEELREASMQAQFERLQRSIDAFVATLPLVVRTFARHIGPYGIRLSAFFPRRGTPNGRHR